MLGSGMTIKFFALFFWKDLGLQPVAVNAVYVAAPVGIAVFAQLAQRGEGSAASPAPRQELTEPA